MHDLETILANHPIFKGIDDRYIKFIMGCASNVVFNANEYIFREGDEVNHFFLIRHGRVAIETYNPASEPIVIDTIGVDDVLGWSWLFPPHRTFFDARATELVRAIALDATCFRNKCEEDHDFGYVFAMKFASVMVKRLQATRFRLFDIYGAK
jgi:CRP/FNR family transcriptional regulator, cyclic AMP receptor protein